MSFKKCFISLHRSVDNKDYAPFPDQLLGSPKLNEHTAQSPPVDGRTLWLLQPAEDSRLFLFYRLDYREYIFETLLLLGFLLPHGSSIGGDLTIG